MRDLPTEIPSKIRRIIQKQYNGSLPEFALASGLKHSTVYSVLCRGSRRKLATISAMAEALDTDIDFLSQILLIENVENRKNVLDKLLDGVSMRQWATKSGISLNAICLTVNSLDQTQLQNNFNVAKALGMTLKDFDDAYKAHTVQTA